MASLMNLNDAHQMTNDSSMGIFTPGECTTGYNSTWESNVPSSATSTFDEYPPQPQPLPYVSHPQQPPQVLARQHQPQQSQGLQPPQLPDIVPDIVPEKVIEDFEAIMHNERDEAVLTNSVCLLFRYTVDTVMGMDVCKALSASPRLLKILYDLLLDEDLRNHDLMLSSAAGNMAMLSSYQEGRCALLDTNHSPSRRCSHGIESLIHALQSRDINRVIFAITAIHNLLLDEEARGYTGAKAQIRHGLSHIVALLDDTSRMMHLRTMMDEISLKRLGFELKVIVLDCLRILAYCDEENKVAIKENGGIRLVLRAIDENFDNQPDDSLIDRASRVLIALSAGPKSRFGIIEEGGVSILTRCIYTKNQEILKTCLNTLRNLSDLINTNKKDSYCVEQLVMKLLKILSEHAEEPVIISGALCILHNLTYKNEPIARLICFGNGVELILRAIENATNHSMDIDILEPAICALVNIMKNVMCRSSEFDQIRGYIRRHLDIMKQKLYLTQGMHIYDEFFEKMNNLESLLNTS